MIKYMPLLFLLLTACGRNPQDHRTIHGVNPTFLPYIEKYISYKRASLYYDIPMQFSSNLGENTLGLCTRWSSGERQIQISEYYWSSLDEGTKYEVITHELGHCDLNRGHNYSIEDGSPISIMYPYAFTLYPFNIDYYMEELFNSSTPVPAAVNFKLNCLRDIEVESHDDFETKH